MLTNAPYRPTIDPFFQQGICALHLPMTEQTWSSSPSPRDPSRRKGQQAALGQDLCCLLAFFLEAVAEEQEMLLWILLWRLLWCLMMLLPQTPARQAQDAGSPV